MPAWHDGQRLLASARNKESIDAEASGPCTLYLLADRQPAELHVARRKAAGVLRGAEHRALCVRHRDWNGPIQPQRTADHTKLCLARLRQPDRKLAPVRNPR